MPMKAFLILLALSRAGARAQVATPKQRLGMGNPQMIVAGSTALKGPLRPAWRLSGAALALGGKI